MKTQKLVKVSAGVLALFFFMAVQAQNQEVVHVDLDKQVKNKKDNIMKTYLIEREIPNAGELTSKELQGISKTSNTVLAEMGRGIEWQYSYVTDNKVYCVYRAKNEALIREHAEKGGFPVNKISELATKIDPKTGRD